MQVRWRVLGRWIAEPRTVWLSAFGIGAAWILAYAVAETIPQQIRYSAAILEIAGIAVVWHGMAKRRPLFGRETLLRRGVRWLSSVRHAFRTPDPVTLQVQSASHAVVGEEVTLRVTAGPNSSLEHRIEVLERNLRELEATQGRRDKRHREQIQHLKRELGEERNARIKAERELTTKLEGVGIQGFEIELVGLIWVATGVVLSSLQPEAVGVIRLISALLN